MSEQDSNPIPAPWPSPDCMAGIQPLAYDLRDEFAKAALQGLIAGDSDIPCCKSLDDDGIERERVAYAEQFAKSAYRYADAMLRERERKPE